MRYCDYGFYFLDDNFADKFKESIFNNEATVYRINYK